MPRFICAMSRFSGKYKDTNSFHRKRETQRNFNKKQSCHDQTLAVRPFTEEVELDKPEQAKGVKATYTNDPLEGEAWLRNNVINARETALGFDMEWRPQFLKKKLGGKENRTAVLQLSTQSACLVLHIFHAEVLPKYLSEILRNEDIVKVGCGIHRDVVKLLRDTGLHCKGVVDLGQLASKIGCTKDQGLSLKALGQNLLGLEMGKQKKVQLSNWEEIPLQRNQIIYAALDAWVGIKLYLYIKGNLRDGEITCLPESALLSSNGNNTKKVYCNVCGKKCKGEIGLKDHIANTAHTACIICGKMFVNQVSEKHLRKCRVAEVQA